MLWYVALVAIVNLLLGYGFGALTGARRSEGASTASGRAATYPIEVTPTKAEIFELLAPAAYSAAAKSPSATDSAIQLPSREYAEQLLAEIVRPGAGNNPVTVALLELDDADQLERSIDERLLHGVSNTIQDLLSDVGIVARYGDQQLLLALPQDATHNAAERAEQVRQRIQATQYLADGQRIKSTVTCALVDVSDQPVLKLLECLEETLAEAKRCGGNRTFLHDGTVPAPVVPQELSFPSQTAAI